MSSLLSWYFQWELVVFSSVVLLYSAAQLCQTLCDPMDCSPPVSSLPGISQARILEWVAISSSRRASQPRDQTLYLLCLLHLQADSLPPSHLGSCSVWPFNMVLTYSFIPPWTGELIEGQSWFSLSPCPPVSSNSSVHRDDKIGNSRWHTSPFTMIFITVNSLS